ncbi:MAG: carbohydrate ABC transporter permease [Anaerolineae bacterium]|jgi:multiple sugar transport system permease protein|nr:carbohydrate ABC transporter permease [Anaerolineae bacterium]
MIDAMKRGSAWLILAGISLLFLIPLLWMISTSLKEPTDLMGFNWIPRRFAWENYQYAFSFGMWGQWTLNTVIITLMSVIGTVLSSSLVAYSFARLRWPGRDLLFGIVLATMMLPGVVTLIPQFILFSKLPAFGFQGSPVWINTFLPLIVPAWTGNAFYIFLLRQFMRGISPDLTEAAKIDGASELRIWWSIILPLCRPVLATVAIFAFQGVWQDFMGPLLYLQSEHLYTLQLGLRQFEFAAGGSPAWNWLMAASLVVMLPVLLVYLCFQQYFIEGFNLTGRSDK